MIVWHCNQCMAPMYDYLYDEHPKDKPMTTTDWQHHNGDKIDFTAKIECLNCGNDEPLQEDQFLRVHNAEGIHLIGELI